MKLIVDRLTATPVQQRYEAPLSWWDEWRAGTHEYEYETAGPLCFEIDAHAMAEDVLLEGRLEGELELECSRCLKRYRHALQDAFRLVLEPAGDMKPPDPESARGLEQYGLCLGEDLESGWYRGKELHLDAFFAEVVSLALPQKPLCSERCPGLCPHCGIDLSQARCDCHDLKPSSPFAALAALRGDMEGKT
jgi:uncharacterized protein